MLSLLFLVACDLLAPKSPDAAASDTAATEPDAVPVAIEAALAACTADGLWTYEAWTDAPIDRATVDAWTVRPDGTHEAHPVGIVRSDDRGADLFLQIPSGAAFVAGEATAFVCGEDDRADDTAFVLRVYGDDGALADCVGWGGAVYRALDDPTGRSGDVPSDLPVAQPGEISRSSCRVLAAG